MKSLFKNIIVPKSHKLAVGASLSIAIAIATTSPANAQVGVSSLDATYEKGTSSSYSTTVGSPCSYSGGCDSNIDMQFGVGDTNDLVLSGFTTGGNNYSLVELADNVGFRRNNDKGATGERQLVFFEYKNNKEIRSSYTNTMAEAMLGNIINRGVDNGFSNDNGIASNNIERIDYIITGGLSAPDAALDNIGFLVLERGGNDPFQIAAITSLDANGKPNAFGPLISVKKSTWGKSSFSVRTTVMRREENEPRFRPSHQIGNQTISGVYTSINSLGVNPGQTIYGYALFPNDINSSNDLVGLSDFPTRTSGSSGQGGLDLMAGGGIFMRDGLTSVSGTLYEDTDGDNNLNSNEAKLPENITVRLLDNNNNEVATATTDSNGDYQFIGVANGNYKIQVDTTDADIPDGYTLGTANDLEITVAGAAVTEQNFGFDPAKASYTVSGTLYEDSDGEDDFDTSEPRLPEDITVTLYNDANDNNIIDDGEEIATTVTDDNGDYIFTDVADGSYKIKVDTDDDEIPSDNTLGTPNDLEITVAGAAVTNQNFGFDKFTNRPLGSPFTCDSTFYITIGPGGGRDQQLFDVDRSGETFTFNTIGPATNTAGGYPVQFDYNALAFNPLDNYIYAYINRSGATSGPYSPGNVVKIGNDGIVHSLGIPTGGTISGNFFAATILSDGTYVIGAGGKFATLDLTTTPPTITNSQTTVSGVAFNDFAVDPRNPASVSGKEVYGINESGNQDRLVILDMTTFPPTIKSQAPNPTGFNHNAGSQFVDAFGTLYYRSNSTNSLYRVNTDSNSSDYGKATLITTAPSGGNHDGVSCLFATGMEKEVRDLDGNSLTEPVPAGETVQYVYKIATGNPLDLNGVTFTDDLRSVAGSNPPVNGTFLTDPGKVTVSNGSGNITFDNNDQTLQITNLTLPGQNPATPESETLTITAEVTIPKTTTPGTYLNQSFLTNLPAIYPPSIPSDYPPSAPYEDPTPVEVTEPIANNPNVLLVKRITKINDDTTTINGDNLSTYNQEDSNPYDDNKLDITELPENEGDPKPDTDKWVDTTSDTSSTFLIGGINGGKVEPDDELEYTIYFLSAGDSEAQNVLVCDRVPGNVSFIPNSFNNNQTQAPGGLPGADKGIMWQKDGNVQALTNVGDGDAAQYFPPGVEPSTVYPKIQCDGTNTNGAIVVNLGNLPNATDPGTPNTSYGFVRFRGKVK